MGTTTISLKQEAYERLKMAKRGGESFSDVVLRLADPPDGGEGVREVAGELGDELATAVEASHEDVRERLEMESGDGG